MNASLFLQQFLHVFCEWVVSFGIAFWIAQVWRQTPVPLVVRVARHPQRFRLAVAFGIAPPILGALLWPLLLRFYQSHGLSMQVPISYTLSVVYGTLLGLSASCCVAPAAAEEPFRPGRAGAISAALIVAAYLFGWLFFMPLLHAAVEIVFTIVVLFATRAIPGGTTAPSPGSPNASPVVRRSPTVALIIGFVPSALILGTIAVASWANLGKQESYALLWICSVVSVLCCFVASIMLFTRKTGGAIAGGILLMLLNAFIAFFFGCCASIDLSGLH
ncbi:MAG: hypothetical protein P4L99_22315 [Chthoniobacter sp.]|nr:hypothetical protein [Chthoniobacter sp.]